MVIFHSYVSLPEGIWGETKPTCTYLWGLTLYLLAIWGGFPIGTVIFDELRWGRSKLPWWMHWKKTSQTSIRSSWIWLFVNCNFLYVCSLTQTLISLIIWFPLDHCIQLMPSTIRDYSKTLCEICEKRPLPKTTPLTSKWSKILVPWKFIEIH